MARNSKKLVAPADFNGPTQHRHCTDILCLLILVAAWVGMTIVGFGYAIPQGDLRLILYPLDYDGNICGTDFALNMTEYPNLLYVNHQTGGVCVKECPNLKGMTEDNLTDVRTLVTYNGIYQVEGAELPVDFIQIGDYSLSNDSIACTMDDCFPQNDIDRSWSSSGIRRGYGYAYYATSTYELLNRCYQTPSAERRLVEQVGGTGDITASITDIAIIDDLYSFWNKAASDVYTARKYVLGFGLGVSMLVSGIYIFLMRLPFLLTLIVWTSIITTVLICFGGGYYALSQASLWQEEDPPTVDSRTIQLTQGFAAFLLILGGVLAFLACCMRRAIMVAIQCTREAGKAVNNMSLILLVPILQSIGFAAFLAAWVYYGAYLASTGELTTKDVTVGLEVDGITDDAPEIAFRVYEFDSFTEYCGWYLLFVLFWTGNFIISMGDLIIAVSVSKWYFAKNKWHVGSGAVLGSILDVAYYHAGTAAFGSLLVAVVQLIRAILTRLQKYAKKHDSKIAQCVLCCCQCCFWCLENLIKFINKNAYIQTAIFSTSFCKSCQEAFALIFRNAARVAAISYVSGAVLIIGKLFISSVVTLMGYYIILEDMGDELFSISGPVTVIFIISYFISDMFMDVLDIGISTVLHCFIADEEMFQGEERYAEKSLTDYVDKHGSIRE